MRAAFSVAIVLAILTAGCTHSHRVTEDSSSWSFDRFNKAAAGRTGRIMLKSGEVLNGYNLHASSDSTSWFIVKTQIRQIASTPRIKKIVFVKRGRGALEGLGLGFLGGAVAGSALGVSLSERNRRGIDGIFSRGEAAIILGVFFGLVGGVTGIPVGVAIGSKDKFIFIKPVDQTSGDQ